MSPHFLYVHQYIHLLTSLKLHESKPFQVKLRIHIKLSHWILSYGVNEVWASAVIKEQVVVFSTLLQFIGLCSALLSPLRWRMNSPKGQAMTHCQQTLSHPFHQTFFLYIGFQSVFDEFICWPFSPLGNHLRTSLFSTLLWETDSNYCTWINRIRFQITHLNQRKEPIEQPTWPCRWLFPWIFLLKTYSSPTVKNIWMLYF